MKKKEIEALIEDETRRDELINVIMEHLKHINDACNERHCEWWNYGFDNPFVDNLLPSFVEFDDTKKYIILWMHKFDRDVSDVGYCISIKIKDLYDFDYCKYAKCVANKEIEFEKQKIEKLKKKIRKSSDRIKELKHHLKGEC